ncbi:MAG TPA: heme-binding protein [Bryobacteraceae bacterium]|nr:heme-binding protein [Bryobacteraceae bacterium]
MTMKIFAIAITACAAFAQNNIDKFVISGAAAKKAMTREINADTAEKITNACVEYAKEHNVAVSVFVLNPTGQIVHAHRMDGQVPINVETALLKAKSVLYTRDSTHARANMVANNLALQLRWSDIGVFPTSGGLPIMVDDLMIGSIGVGGSNQDEECAYAALTSVVGPQPPLAPKTPAAPAQAPAKP